MSYPPQPGQDPNNPYAQPQQPQPQQPGYGYPQQGHGLPSYGGPAEQGYPMGPGYGAPTTMPGGVNAARIMLYVTGALSVLGAVAMLLLAAVWDDVMSDEAVADTPNAEMLRDLGVGVIVGMGVLYLAFAVGGILLAAKFAKGGNGVRIGSIVYGGLMVLVGVLSAPVGLLFAAVAVLVIVFVAKGDGSAWFNRPRH